MKGDSRDRGNQFALLIGVVDAFVKRSVNPGVMRVGGDKVRGFFAAESDPTPIHPALETLSQPWVREHEAARGVWVRKDALSAFLGELMACAPGEALRRFAALVWWRRGGREGRAAGLGYWAVDETWQTIAELPSEADPPRDRVWLAEVLFGQARPDETAQEALLLAAIASDARVEVEDLVSAMSRDGEEGFCFAVIDGMLARNGWTLRLLEESWLCLPSTGPLADWVLSFSGSRYYRDGERLLPAGVCALGKLIARLQGKWAPPARAREDGTSTGRAILNLLEHLEALERHEYGLEHESHVARAKEEAARAGYFLGAFAPWFIRVFAEKLAEPLVEILSFAANDAVLERIAVLTRGDERLGKPAAVADTILRRCGAVAPVGGEGEQRQLVGPLEPIRGQTWLNDLRLEHLLYEAARRAEEAFAREYSTAPEEGEDDLLRDLFDRFIGPELSAAVDAANSLQKRGGQMWRLRWSKFSKAEEVEHGADLALEVVVSIYGRLNFSKTCFVQVKRMRAKDGRFRCTWRLDAQQRSDLLRVFGPTAFYLLLTPSAVSGQQRVLPVDVAHGILAAVGNAESLSDGIAGRCAHSLAHFLVYDALGGWQGDPARDLARNPVTGRPRQGRLARYILRVKLEFGG